MPPAILAIVLAALALLPATAGAATGPALSVTAGADEHAISPDIYGLNYASDALRSELALPVNRWGGNTTDTYNWDLGVASTGNDYFFENIADCWAEEFGYCTTKDLTYRAYRSFIEGNRATATKTLLTLPTMGRVAKEPRMNHPFLCGFPKTVFASQQAFDPFDANCGNGKATNGTNLASDPDRDSVAGGAAFNGAWVDDLKARYGGVDYYELGNEPALWPDTHRNMHPAKTSYDELWTSSRDTAVLVKQKDPTAKVLGFSEWGWPNYFCSAKDDTSNGCQASDIDRAAHGGTPIVEWFLQQARTHEQTTGTRLVDYIDVHYYRQGGSTPEVTRSLWDPGYTDPSWINEKIQLLPRMRKWVADTYPGTRLALSEYNLSVSGDAVANALIQADTLGIFAREGLDLATRWAMPDDGDEIPDAFRMFRNYDGAGGKFGETYVRSASGDQGALAVYGARRSADGALTILVVNKGAQPLTSSLALSGFTPSGGAAAVWQWNGTAPTPSVARVADQAVTASGFSATYPARSLTLVVVPPAATPDGGTPPTVGNPPASPQPPVGPSPGASPPPARPQTPTVKPLNAKTLLAAAHLTKRARADRKGRVTVGYVTCPPVCGTVSLSGAGDGRVKAKGTKRIPLVITLSRAARKTLSRKKRLTARIIIRYGSLTTTGSVSVQR